MCRHVYYSDGICVLIFDRTHTLYKPNYNFNRKYTLRHKNYFNVIKPHIKYQKTVIIFMLTDTECNFQVVLY